MQKSRTKLVVAAIAALAAELIAPALNGVAQAAPPPQFTQAFLRLDRLKTGEATGGTVCATPSTTSTTYGTVAITFPTQTGTDFTLSGTPTDWAIDAAPLPTGSTLWPGLGTSASNVSGHTVTWTSGNLTLGTQYCFHFTGTSTLTNGAAGPSLVGQITAYDNAGTPAVINQTNYALAIIPDDQIVLSAVVPPNFTFTIASAVDSFGTLNPSAIKSTSGVMFTVVTNAKAGWIGWVKSQYGGLNSATAGYTITSKGLVDGTPTTLVANNVNEDYVLDALLTFDAAGGCTLNIDPEYYDAALTNTKGGTLSTNFQPVANCNGAAPATSNGDQVTLIERATIAGGTPAGSDYTDVLTVVAAGNF